MTRDSDCERSNGSTTTDFNNLTLTVTITCTNTNRLFTTYLVTSYYTLTLRLSYVNQSFMIYDLVTHDHMLPLLATHYSVTVVTALESPMSQSTNSTASLLVFSFRNFTLL